MSRAAAAGSFAQRVAGGMARRGKGLRALCREVGLDPSFFSKVLSGKRSPPGEESSLRAIAAALELDAAGLIVSAGRIPAEWRALSMDPDLFESANALITGLPARPALGGGEKPGRAAWRVRETPASGGGLSEELL